MALPLGEVPQMRALAYSRMAFKCDVWSGLEIHSHIQECVKTQLSLSKASLMTFQCIKRGHLVYLESDTAGANKESVNQ